MRLPNIALSFLALIIATASIPITFSRSASSGELPVLAQIPADPKAEAMRLLQQSLKQFKNGQFETALQSSQLALSIYREIKDRQGEGVALNVVGLAYQGLGNYGKAIEYNQQYLVLAQEIKDQYAEVSALLNLGNIYASQGNHAKAIEYLKQSLTLARRIQSPELEKLAQESLASHQEALQRTQKLNQEAIPQAETNNNPLKQQADSLLQQGIKQIDTKQFEAALQSFRQALTIYRQLKNRQREIVALKAEMAALAGLAIPYIAQGDYPRAIEYYQQSLLIAQEIEEPLAEATTLASLGVAFNSLGNYSKAIDYLQKSLGIAQKIQNRQAEGNALMALADAYIFLGDYLKAIEYSQKSLVIAREMKNLPGQISTLGSLGNAYDFLGDYPKAIEYHQQSLSIARDIKEPLAESNALGNMGNAYTSLGDYATAIQKYQQALTIVRKINNLYSEGSLLINLGIVYDSLGDSVKAIDYYQQSLAIARQVKDRNGEGSALLEMGNSYSNLENYPKAIEYFQQGLAIGREIKVPNLESKALGNLGLTYYYLGDYPKAIEYSQKFLAIARQVKDRKGEGSALGNLGLTYYSLGDYVKAIDYHQNGLAITRQIKDRDGEGRSLSNLGLAYQKAGNLKAAEITLRTGIEVWKSLRRQLGKNDSYKVSIFEQQARTYRILQNVLIANNKTNEALEISEQGRARAFVELLTSRLSNNITSLTPEKPTISLLQQIAKQQNTTLVEYSVITDDFKIQGKQEWKELELYIWVIKPTGKVTFRKVDLKPLWQKENTTLAQLVSTTRESLGVSDDERSIFKAEVVNPGNENIQRNSLQKLHQLLIKPIADLLPTDPNQRVTFIPQNNLFLLPFPALLDGQGKHLIEKHTILTAPAIQVLELTRKQKQRIGAGGSIPKNTVVVGNPTMPEYTSKYGEAAKQLKPLPGSEKEVKAIASLLNTQALTGKEATETAIKAKLSQARIIHLATHGLFDNFQGLQSSIALTPSAVDDGFLTADEILDLKLNADLVVLSACNTGRGKITGDGVIGLSRSLLIAGTPSVLVSLWSVPDAPTAELMTEFYQNLYQKKLNKAQALRQAMLKVKEQYPNQPKKWAAFTLIGEAE
jgi:CHAT domain-containing protein